MNMSSLEGFLGGLRLRRHEVQFELRIPGLQKFNLLADFLVHCKAKF